MNEGKMNGAPTGDGRHSMPSVMMWFSVVHAKNRTLQALSSHLRLGFSIETRLKRFSGLKRSGFKLLPHYFIGRSNIVSYDHTTWWLLW